MPKLSKDWRIALVRAYYRNGSNAAAALRDLRHEMNLRKGPCDKKTVQRLVKKYELTGSVTDAPRSGRPKTSVDTVIEIGMIADAISEENAHGECSVRAVAKASGVAPMTAWRALRKELRLYPYRIQRLHKLEPGDPQRRLAFAQDFLTRVAIDDDWLDTILWTDEAHFTLTGQVNSRNCVIWANENPHAFVQTPLHDQKVTVWCGVTSHCMLGPYFFDEIGNDGEAHTVTVNGNRYLQMLQEFVVPQLQQRNLLDETTFMQDGAPPHTPRLVKIFLQSHFGERIISRGFANAWPPRSPDLTPLDFWLWGFLKSKVYGQQPRSLPALRHVIQEQIESITPDQLRAAIYHVITRMQAVVDTEGKHIEHLTM